ncbi:MAG: phosphotransferase family protein [Dactylosporangium sp.]|nr:phosphotransferase family protein [Dactylosporangium sp.]
MSSTAESGSADNSPPGLDLERVGPYLAQATDGALTGPLTATVISGGRSNLTYLVSDETRRAVVRRPPLGHVLPSAHDMAREFRVISALSVTGFPVPEPLLLCPDAEVIGAPFYVMEYVDGVVLRGAETVAPDRARACGETLVDLLVSLHGVDHQAVGLGDFGRPEGYLERQVGRWHQQWERSKTRELPLLEEVTARLAKEIPDSPSAGIVHGDYRLDNVMFSSDLSTILAVMDWEMATIGDPLADVGLLVVYTDLAQLKLTPPVPDGFPSGAELAARYAAATGIDVARLNWYVAFGNYKLAVISEGIHARYLQGKTVGAGFETFGRAVPTLIERAAATLGE